MEVPAHLRSRNVPSFYRLCVSLLVFSICFVISGLGASVSRLRFPPGPGCSNQIGDYCDYYSFPSNTTGVPPLPDLLLSSIPYMCDVNGNFPSYFLLTSMIATLICLMIVDEDGRQVFMRFCIVDGFLLLLRGITISFTQLSNPTPQCVDCGSSCPTDLWSSLIQTVTYPYPLGTCGDMMFSGHTAHYLLMALTWQTYMRITHPNWSTVIIPFIWITTSIGIFSLISCRVHYTDDIIVATLLVSFSWLFYGYFINNPPNQLLRKQYHPVARFILWIEQL